MMILGTCVGGSSPHDKRSVCWSENDVLFPCDQSPGDSASPCKRLGQVKYILLYRPREALNKSQNQR